jgi:hypothetical protein
MNSNLPEAPPGHYYKIKQSRYGSYYLHLYRKSTHKGILTYLFPGIFDKDVDSFLLAVSHSGDPDRAIQRAHEFLTSRYEGQVKLQQYHDRLRNMRP